MADIFKPEDLVIAKDDVPTVSMGPYRAQWVECELEINAGDLYYCPPGHKLFAIEDFENLEFNPAPEAQKTMAAFAANIAKAEAKE